MNKLIQIVLKSLKEQLRSFWVLLLSLSIGPFFIFVYFLITESSKEQYDILILNNEKVIPTDSASAANDLVKFLSQTKISLNEIPFKIKEINDKAEGIEALGNKTADALIIIPDSFSFLLHQKGNKVPEVGFLGDLTSTSYLISAVWANEMLNEFMLQATQTKRLVTVKETALGVSGTINEFDMLVPGILIVSLIMLMFTSSIAFVSEVENKTMLRLKLSKIKAIEFLSGISLVQLGTGIISVLLTLLTAIALGFHYQGSLLLMFIIAGLTSLSLISFSLIIAAATRSANEVLVVGNFPMFLFMFFTGAAFPMKSEALFSIAGYPVNIQGLMTPTHAISALNKTFVMNMSFSEVMPEILAILILSLIYFIAGAFLFQKRHLRLG